MKKFKAVGHRLVVKPREVETVSEGGIDLSAAINKDREQAAEVYGTVIEVGPTAFDDLGGKENWVQEGDLVCYAKYAGMHARWPEYSKDDGEDYLIVNDNDIIAKVVEE